MSMATLYMPFDWFIVACGYVYYIPANPVAYPSHTPRAPFPAYRSCAISMRYKNAIHGI